MSTDIMIDLETLGLQPGCVLLSVGAAAFNLWEPNSLGDTFHCNVNRTSCVTLGMFIDKDTELWWSQQSEEARAGLWTPQPVDLSIALYHFFGWIDKHGSNVRVWSHGAGFDLPLIHDAARRVGFRVPWSFRNERDTRTLFHMARNLLPWEQFKTIMEQKSGVHHHAKDDAVTQAEQVWKLWIAIHESKSGVNVKDEVAEA